MIRTWHTVSAFYYYVPVVLGNVAIINVLVLSRCSPLGSSVRGIFQARILEWVAISSSRGSSPPRDQTHVSYIAGGFFTTVPPGKPLAIIIVGLKLSQNYKSKQTSPFAILSPLDIKRKWPDRRSSVL